MIGIGRMRNLQQDRLVQIRNVRIVGRGIFSDRQRAIAGPRVVDEEAAIARKERMKGQAEQSALATGEHLRADVQEGADAATRLNHVDDAALLEHEQPVRTVTGVGDECRIGNACRNRDQPRLRQSHWRGQQGQDQNERSFHAPILRKAADHATQPTDSTSRRASTWR